MICRSIWFAFVEEPLATGLAQEARDNEARRLILRAFSNLGHLFSNISRHKYHDQKTIKNYVIGRSTSSHPEKITSYENGTTTPATTRGIRLVSKSRQLYFDAGSALVLSWYELQFNVVRWLNLFTITKLLSERPTLALHVPLFLLGHFPTNECEISDFCL